MVDMASREGPAKSRTIRLPAPHLARRTSGSGEARSPSITGLWSGTWAARASRRAARTAHQRGRSDGRRTGARLFYLWLPLTCRYDLLGAPFEEPPEPP